jgi:hypothetical protein
MQLVTRTHEKVISGHSWLPGNTGGDDNDISTLQGLLGTIVRGEKPSNLSG